MVPDPPDTAASDCYAGADTDTYSDTHPNAYAHSDSHTYAYSDPDAYPHAYADPDTHADSDSG